MPWRGPLVPGEFPTGGYVVLDWIRDNLTIPDGPRAGEPFEFYDEQKLHVLHKYRVDPRATQRDGNDAFQYGGSMLVRGQKWGKDPVLGALDLVHGFGPCDFAGYSAAGEVVMKPHPSPWIAVAALNDDQANNTWFAIKAMVENSSLVDLPGVEVNLDQVRLPCGNPIEKLTCTAFGRLGGRFTKVSLTENGLMTATGEGGNTGKRSPLSYAGTLIRSVDGMQGMWTAATNTWDPTEHSHAQRVYEAQDPHTYVDAKVSRKRIDLADDEELEREIVYLYGDSLKSAGGHQSTQRLMRSCRDESKLETDRRRFFLSEILAGQDEFATPAWWAAQARSAGHPEHDPLKPGDAIAVGFDGSRSRDATILIAVRIRDCRIFPLRIWYPACHCEAPRHRPEKCRDKKIPRLEVDAEVDRTFAAYTVWYLFGDPFKYDESLELWAAKHGNKERADKGLPRQPVVEVPTNNEQRMDAMVERWLTLRDANEVTHSGDDEVTMHVDSSVIAKGRRKLSKLRTDTAGRVVEYYRKVVRKREGEGYIDYVIGILLALEARGQAIAVGALTEKPPAEPDIPTSFRDRDLQPAGRRPVPGDFTDWDDVRF